MHPKGVVWGHPQRLQWRYWAHLLNGCRFLLGNTIWPTSLMRLNGSIWGWPVAARISMPPRLVGSTSWSSMPDDKVIVNPLRIRPDYLRELEFNILLYYTGTSRLSADIIEKQSSNFTSGFEKPIEAAHKLKEQAQMMKKALFLGDLHSIGEILDFGWTYKKQTAAGVTNPLIDEIYSAARLAGATWR